MDVLLSASGFAFGRTELAGGPGSSAPETAHGVHVAIHAANREAGIDDLAGMRVLVQGLGAVGCAVAELVAEEGARVVATDVDAARCDQARGEFDAEIIGVDDVLTTASDVFVPCVTGGIVDDASAATIPTRVIAGAANNLLVHESAADVLADRGIVLAPDFVANDGGAIHLVGREVLGWDAEEVSAHVEGIGDTLQQTSTWPAWRSRARSAPRASWLRRAFEPRSFERGETSSRAALWIRHPACQMVVRPPRPGCDPGYPRYRTPVASWIASGCSHQSGPIKQLDTKEDQ